MIINFKIYSTKLNISENKIFENKFELEPYSYWIIYGDENKVIAVLDRFSSVIGKEYNNDISKIKRTLTYGKIGTFIVFYPYYFDSYSFENKSEKNLIMNNLKNSYGITFKGEIKLENNTKIILDTLELDINKYNL